MRNSHLDANCTPADKIYARLKAYVLSGQIEPGSRIHQAHCAKILAVSRTPVREALQRLATEGLVERLEDRGFRVVRLSVDELEELFDMRSLLESFAMRQICRRIIPETIDALTRCVKGSETALNQRDADGIFKANTDFHNTLYSLIQDKKRFITAINNMQDHILRYRKQTLMHFDRAEKSINAHKKIIFALGTRDPNLTEYLMRIHIEESKEDALEINFGIRKKGLLSTERF